MRTGRRHLSLLAVAALSVPLALGAGPAEAAAAAKPYDLDGDGKADLVSGAPLLNRGSIRQSGGLVVSYATGRTAVVTQSTRGVAGASEPGDFFGGAVASADFDSDGYADLAVGLPGEDFSGHLDAGAVTVLYGSAKGLTGTRSTQIAQPNGKHTFASFGASLAVGDVNGDGHPDLVVGAPGDELDPDVRDDYPPSGTVTVLRGSATGVRTSGSTLLRGDRGPTWDHGFGSAVAVADVDDDDRQDVVVVSEGAQEDGSRHDGSLSSCAGSAAGVTACRRLLHTAALSNAGPVVVGNVEGSDRPEVLVGVPVTDVDSDPGSVQVVRLSGSGSGTTAVATRFDQEDAGLPGTGEESGDYFGASLALAQVDGDAYDDLVVGAPGEAVVGRESGRVFLVEGGSAGLATSGNRAWDQSTAGVPGSSESGDAFGAAVSLLDVTGDRRVDLVVGAPGEDGHTGRVTVLPGSGPFGTTGARAFGLKDLGVSSADRSRAALGDPLGQ